MKFKVGDKLFVTGNTSGHNFKVGQVIQIKSIDPCNNEIFQCTSLEKPVRSYYVTPKEVHTWGEFIVPTNCLACNAELIPIEDNPDIVAECPACGELYLPWGGKLSSQVVKEQPPKHKPKPGYGYNGPLPGFMHAEQLAQQAVGQMDMRAAPAPQFVVAEEAEDDF